MEDYTNFYELIEEMAGFFIFFLLLILAFAIVGIIANWKMYKKAGKKGWECIVPFYGYWVLTEIAELEWWWFLLAVSDSIVTILGLDDLSMITSLVSLFAIFNIYYNIAKKFGKENGMAVVAGIFSGIFVLIFGFSKNAVYNSNIPVSKNGVFGTPEENLNTNQTTYNQYGTTNTSEQEFSYCSNCGTKLNKNIRFCPNCGKEKI